MQETLLYLKVRHDRRQLKQTIPGPLRAFAVRPPEMEYHIDGDILKVTTSLIISVYLVNFHNFRIHFIFPFSTNKYANFFYA